MSAPAQPLAGICVVDLSQIYQGPYASLLLALGGADVVKVEPRRGETLRGGPERPPSMAFAMLNSNKRSITLDLKQPRGCELFWSLAERADVVLENFAPGVTDRLGISAEALRACFPRLIYASGTGFGQTGPDRDQLAMDHTVQAMGGMMSVTGLHGGAPLRAGGAVADILGGVHLYAGIITALFERERSGRGRIVEIAMQEAMFPTFSSAYTNYHHTRRTPAPAGNGPLGAPSAPYNVYPTSDGWLAIICVTQDHWERLVVEMGREDLLGVPRFADRAQRGRNAAEVDEIVSVWAAGLTRDEAYRAMRRARVPGAPVRDLVEILEDPHMHERGMLQWFDHEELGRVVLPHSPLGFPESPRVPLRSSPRTGQHNREVYGGWLGLSDTELDALEKNEVI